MLRLIITDHGEDWSETGSICAVCELPADRLTRKAWRSLMDRIQGNYHLGTLLSWNLVRVQSTEDPWEISVPWGLRTYGEPVAFGQMGSTYPDRIWESAWRWIGNHCQKCYGREYNNAD